MKKTIMLQDLDCANCAAKIENAVCKMEGIKTASVSFMTGKMELEASEGDFDALLKNIKKIVRKVDADITVLA